MAEIAKPSYSIQNPSNAQKEATARAFACAEAGNAEGLAKALDDGADRGALIDGSSNLWHIAWWLPEKQPNLTAKLFSVLLDKGVHPDMRDEYTDATIAHDLAEEKQNLTPLLSSMSWGGANLKAQNRGGKRPYEVASEENKSFLLKTQELWQDIAARALKEKMSGQGLRKAARDAILESAAKLAHAQAHYKRALAAISDPARPEDDFFDVYPQFLLTIAPLEMEPTLQTFSRLRKDEQLPRFRQQVEAAIERLTPERIVLRLGSVMPRNEIFSPAYWTGNEEEALGLIKAQHPWFQEEVRASRALLEAAIEQKKIIAQGPLQDWQRRIQGGEPLPGKSPL